MGGRRRERSGWERAGRERWGQRELNQEFSKEKS